MAVLASIAFVPRMTLWGLLELKMEILVQVSPVFILGAMWERLDGRAAFYGMLVGALLASGFALGGVGGFGGFHAGLVAWAVNVAICVGLSFLFAGEQPGDHSPAGKTVRTD